MTKDYFFKYDSMLIILIIAIVGTLFVLNLSPYKTSLKSVSGNYLNAPGECAFSETKCDHSESSLFYYECSKYGSWYKVEKCPLDCDDVMGCFP